MTGVRRWLGVAVCAVVTLLIDRRLFRAALRRAHPSLRAVGQGRVYDSWLTDHGHWVAGACVTITLIDGATGDAGWIPPWVRDAAVYAFAGWCGLLLWVDTRLARVFRAADETGVRLLTRGPYALVRHPRYLSWVGLLASVAVVAGSRPGLAATGCFLTLVLRRVTREERYMRATQGTPYLDYMARTRRLVPWVY